MALGTRRRGNGNGLDAWPGYVDALSTLLMVIIFVLLVFVLAQAFLSVTLSRKDQSLDKLNRQVSQLSDMLSLEQSRSGELKQALARVNADLAAAGLVKDKLTQQVATLQDSSTKLASARDALQAERDRLAAQFSDSQAQAQSAARQAASLQAQLADAATKNDAAGRANAAITAQYNVTEGQLEAAQKQLAAMQAQIKELDTTVSADKQTIQARLSDLANLSQQVQVLTALRDQLQQQAQDANARAMTEEQKRKALAAQLADEKDVSQTAKAQIAALTQQMSQLRAQLAAVSAALDTSDQQAKAKDVQIADLGQKLNMALAKKVQNLQQYRSEFFGKLREVLANRPGIRVVGDRFVFQSEVLFPLGSADLTPQGEAEINKLADTLKQIIPQIPQGVNWLLRVDGHTDPQPIKGGSFGSNWELSTARAVNVVKLLVKDGLPADRLAAAGFGQYQPITPGDAPDDYAKDRRIEFRLTDR